jgi:hypothetical protein
VFSHLVEGLHFLFRVPVGGDDAKEIAVAALLADHWTAGDHPGDGGHRDAGQIGDVPHVHGVRAIRPALVHVRGALDSFIRIHAAILAENSSLRWVPGFASGLGNTSGRGSQPVRGRARRTLANSCIVRCVAVLQVLSPEREGKESDSGREEKIDSSRLCRMLRREPPDRRRAGPGSSRWPPVPDPSPGRAADPFYAVPKAGGSRAPPHRPKRRCPFRGPRGDGGFHTDGPGPERRPESSSSSLEMRWRSPGPTRISAITCWTRDNWAPTVWPPSVRRVSGATPMASSPSAVLGPSQPEWSGNGGARGTPAAQRGQSDTARLAGLRAASAGVQQFWREDQASGGSQ